MTRGPALLALLLAGCATVPPPPPSPPVILPEGRELLERWEAAWQRFPGFRAVVELSLSRQGTTQRTAGVLLLAPTALRFEAVSPFGLPLLIVAANQETVTIWSTMERRAVIAPATAEGINRWLHLPLAPEDLVRLLAGQVRPLREPESVRTLHDDDGPRVEVTRGRLRQRVWVGPGLAPRRLELDGERRHLEAAFEWAPNGRLLEVRLSAPEQEAEVSLRYQAVEVAAVPGEAFVLRLPADVKIQRVD